MGGVNCGKLDLTSIPQDDIVSINDQNWLKIDVDEKIYLVDNDPHVVIKFSNMCAATVCNDQQSVRPSLGGLTQNAEADNSSPSNGSSQSQSTSLPSNINDEREDLSGAETAVDISSIDAFSWWPAAVKPSSAVVPMKSNIRTYGPYASSNFGSSYGGTQVEVNSDLAPWVFGSTSLMNQAGQAIVDSSAIGLIKAETGNITVPGLPLSSFTSLGIALNGTGPTLSSLTFSYGAGGLSTTYEFRTYTPKFGGLNRHLVDKIKSVAKNRTEQLRFLRSNQIVRNKISRKIQNAARINNQNAPAGTLQRVLIAEIYDWENISDGEYSQRTVVGIDSLRKSVYEMVYDYKKKAYMSLDALYAPVSKDGDGGLPKYANFTTGDHKASPQAPQPPFAIEDTSSETQTDPFVSGLNQYHLEITQDYSDPLTNPFEDEGHHHDGEGKGHVIDLVGRNEELPVRDEENPDGGMITNFYDLDDENRYSEDYRFLGMRGPIVLQSWGYDLDGKPIPNAADTYSDSKSGVFTNENLKDQFLSDWLAKPATWPVAPIDFRFDRKRGLWVTPPGYKVVVAKLDEELKPYGTAKASLINNDTENDLTFGDPIYDKDGNEVTATDEEDSQAKIQIEDRLGIRYSAGTKAYCYYDTFQSKYIVLNAPPKICVRFRLIDFCEGSPPEPDYGDDWTKHAGYGDKFPNNHILGIRVDCNGDPIDSNGNSISHDDITDPEKRKDIFINLFDTVGSHGPAYAFYNKNGGPQSFVSWLEKSSTGFGILADPNPENSCYLGTQGSNCSVVDPELISYDILFLDSYARFIECELTQKLYISQEKAEEEYAEDEYKIQEPEGNAAATVQKFYGNSPNGIEPKFYKFNQGGLDSIDFRVFDPYKDYPKSRNPFAKLDSGDKVLAIFDEKRKKYIIYSSLSDTEKVIKFALVDNKDLGDRTSRAVLVDIEGYPIDDSGERLTEENFSEHFITVFDSFAIHGYSDPVPSYTNYGTTGFGPALGSDSFSEHMNGILVSGGDQNSPEGSTSWKCGPFIGYAIQRKMPKDVSSDLSSYDDDNEIFFLESFAKTVSGKIASTTPIINSEYYAGVLRCEDINVKGGFIDGRLPFTRDSITEDVKANLRVKFPIDQHQSGKYITGSWYDSEYLVSGDAWNSVDGCKFVAVLDNVTSKVNNGTEKLYYTIVEIDNIANRAKTVLTKKETSDALNGGSVTEKSSGGEGIISEYLDGFMWDKEKSKTNYEKVTLFNREDWNGKALILKWNNEGNLHIRSSLNGYEGENNKITYKVDFAGTIAQIAEANLNNNQSGKFGFQGAVSKNDKLISKFNNPKFYHGLSPLSPEAELIEEDQPIIDVTNSSFMTYDGSKVIGLWDEYAPGSKIENGTYRVIYAEQAPVIITAVAQSAFKPSTPTVSIILSQKKASCPGIDQEPIPTLLGSAKNDFGYGADAGDYVTLQRVHINTLQDDTSNYYYIIIGTSAPPGKAIPSPP